MTTDPTEPTPGFTGSPIDDAVAGLGALEDLEICDHPAVFESIHRVLRDQLAGTPGVPA